MFIGVLHTIWTFNNHIISWSKLNLTSLLKSLGLTMVLNSKWLISLRLIVSYADIVVLPFHNKILLWRGNINIFCVLQEPWEFNKMFQLFIGVTAFSQQSTSSIDFHPRFFITKHLLNCFMTNHLITLPLEFLVAYVLPPL